MNFLNLSNFFEPKYFIYIRDINYWGLKIMALEARAAEFQTKVLGSINETADNANQRMQEKKAQYDAAKQQESCWDELRQNAQSKYEDLMYQYRNGKNPTGLQEAKSRYDSIMSGYCNATINADVLGDSYSRSISYCSKMNNSASIANAILA